METKEIIKELVQTGQTYTILAAKLQVTELTVRRWATGLVPCNVATIEYLSRLLRSQRLKAKKQ